MERLVGWSGPGPEGEFIERAGSHLAAGLPGQVLRAAVGEDDAHGIMVCARPDRSGDGQSAQGGILAGIIGMPRWSDATLEELGRAQGNAAALVEAYRRYGTGFVEKLGGTFAVSLIDTEKNRALIATDRMATRPLYYMPIAGPGVIFSSTIGAIQCHRDASGSINRQALYDYCYFHMVPSPESIYEGIYKLEPAECLISDGDGFRKYIYWKPDYRYRDDSAVDVLEKELLEHLKASVGEYLSLENLGCFLSGGVDSSTVTGMLSVLNNGTTNAYSIGFSEEGYDEIGYARIAARHYGAALHEYYVTPDDIVEAIPVIARAYEEPFGNSSAIPALYCARLARNNGIEVMLAGDGGDELFAGNERYAKQKIFDIYTRVPAALRRFVLEPLLVSLPLSRWLAPARKVRSYIEQARIPMPQRMETYNYLNRTPLRTIFDDGFLDGVDTGHPEKLLEEVYSRADTESLVDRMLYLDWKFTLADNDLQKVSKMCEVAGVDVVYPMLDDRLVEFSTRVPPGLKLKGRKLRYFYKQALSDFLPREVITKHKHGFGLPFGQWLKKSDSLQQLVYSNLEAAKARKIFKPEFIDQLILAHRGGHAAYYGSMVWVVTLLEQWFQEH